MAQAEKIRTATERSIKTLGLRPTMGRKTAVSRIRVRDGLTCDVEEGRWKLTSDLSEVAGGNGLGPDPGVLGRAALGSCVAMGYMMWAAVRGVPVSAVEVEVQADFDAGGQYGVGEAVPGYSEVRYAVNIESPAPEADILALVEEADAKSPYLDVFGRAQKLVRTVEVKRPEE
jgi:uncharacterized OsmC-like protein